MNIRRIGSLFAGMANGKKAGEAEKERPVRECDECARGYTYCRPFDRWYVGECPRRSEKIWPE